MPTGANPELESTAGDMVQGRRRFCEQCGIAIAHVKHEAPDACILGFRRQGTQRGERFEVRFGTVFGRCLVEVIPRGYPIYAALIECPPKGAHLVHGHVLLTYVHAE